MGLKELMNSGNAVFLDTETTGLDGTAEVIEISVIDTGGNILLDTLVKSRFAVPMAATNVHHITDQMLVGAPQWHEIAPKYHKIVSGKTIIVYNADYDRRVIGQTATLGGCLHQENTWFCLMRHLKDTLGLRKWVSLDKAAAFLSVPLPTDNLHRALADTKLALEVARALAAREVA